MRALLSLIALLGTAAGCCGDSVFLTGDHCASDTAVVCATVQGVKIIRRTDCAEEGKKCKQAACSSKNVAACVAEGESVCEAPQGG